MASSISCFSSKVFEPYTCSIETHKATALVLAVLGATVLFVGLFLMYGGIGTISASFGGFCLTLAGVTGIASSLFLGLQ